MMNTIEIHVDGAAQTLTLFKQHKRYKDYLISTGARGFGEQKGSYQTPRGWHQIRAKIGTDCPSNTVFVGRRATGEIYSPALGLQYPGRDWMLTRLLWLSGLEVGKNRLGNVDTLRRYIYIHGAPDTTELGKPGSHGCIRMRNSDLIELFELLPLGTKVLIEAKPS